MRLGTHPGMGRYVLRSGSGVMKRRGLGDVSAVTPLQALQQAMSGLSSPDFQDSGWMSVAQSDVQNMNIQFSDPLCAGSPQVSDLAIIKTAGGLGVADAGQVAQALANAGSDTAESVLSAIPIIGAIFSTIIGIFTIFSQHHQAAVRQENQIACALVPAANNFFQAIQQSVANGQIAPADAVAALQSLPDEFQQQAAPSYGTNPCNAMCEYTVVVRAICIYWAAQYAAMPAPQPVAVINPTPTTVATPTPTPAQVQQTQQQISTLTTQAQQAQANGDTATSAALLAQVQQLEASLTASPTIPTWAYLAAAAVGLVLVLR